MSESKVSFFKQSGWMMVATFGGGVLMLGVQLLANRPMSVAEYTELLTLLKIITFISIPVGGLTTVFAHQAAAASDEEAAKRLRSCARTILSGTVLLWGAMLALAAFGEGWIMETMQLTSRPAFWMTMVVALSTLLTPLIRGLLQGAHRFGPLGWTLVADGVIRFFGALFILFVVTKSAAGVMTAALIGQWVALGIGVWWTRELFLGPGSTVDWSNWIRTAAPLIVGSGVIVFFISADFIFARTLFPEIEDIEKLYVPGNMVGFAMAQLAVPIAAVMFPRVVRNATHAGKGEELRWTLILTAVIGGAASLLATVAPWLPVLVIFKGEYAEGKALVPWYAWSMLIFTLANALVSNLMARSEFRVIKWLAAVAVLYGLTLFLSTEQLKAMEPLAAYRRVVMILGGFSAALFVVAALHTRDLLKRKPTPESA